MLHCCRFSFNLGEWESCEPVKHACFHPVKTVERCHGSTRQTAQAGSHNTRTHAKFCRKGVNNSSSNYRSSTKKEGTRGHSHNALLIPEAPFPQDSRAHVWPRPCPVVPIPRLHLGLTHIDVIGWTTRCLHLFIFLKSNKRQINIK